MPTLDPLATYIREAESLANARRILDQEVCRRREHHFNLALLGGALASCALILLLIVVLAGPPHHPSMWGRGLVAAAGCGGAFTLWQFWRLRLLDRRGKKARHS